MNKRGVALIFALLVIIVLLILLSSFFLRSMNENSLVRRYVNSTRALWLAEAGAAEAIKNLPTPTTTPVDEPLEDNPYHRYIYTSTWSSSPQAGVDIYEIKSEGKVLLSDGSFINRKIEVFVSFSPLHSGPFDLAVEVNGPLKLAGNCKDGGCIYPDSSLYKDYANLSFSQRFGISSDELESIAASQGTHYTNPDPHQAFNGITWIDIVEPTTQLKINDSNWSGSGILVVNGDTDIEAGEFNGILWVIGKLYLSGNVKINGAAFAECDADLQSTLTGNPTITYLQSQIDAALDLLTPYGQRAILAWHEE